MLADIFDLQRHLFKIEFKQEGVFTYIKKQVWVMVRQVSILNCRSARPGSNFGGDAGKDIFSSLLFSYVSDGTLRHRST